MAAVNNIAATFSASRGSSALPASSAPMVSSQALTPAISATAARPISASWNPHSALPLSQRSSLLGLYGLPGPRPRPLLRPMRPLPAPPTTTPIAIGDRLPDASLSFLDQSGTVRAVSISELTRGRKAVIMAVPGAFAPPLRPRWWCSGSGGANFELSPAGLVKRAGEMRERGVARAGAMAVALVAANDVYVMRAWGERLGAAEGEVMMLSDPDAELARSLGLALDLRGGTEGLGVRSEGYLMVAVNGMVRALFRNHHGGGCIGDGECPASASAAIGSDAATAEFDDMLRVL